MNKNTIAAFLDELEKIALAGAVPKAPPPPKTSTPTPAPQARMAPTPMVKPPQIGAARSASSVANRGAIRPGTDLSSAVRQGANTQLGAQLMLQKQPPPPRPVTKVPQPSTVPLHSKIPRVATRGVVTNPIGRVSRRPTASELGIPGASPF